MSHQLPYKGTVASEKYLTNATVKVLKLRALKLRTLWQRLCFDEAYITQTPLSNQNTKFYSDFTAKYCF